MHALVQSSNPRQALDRLQRKPLRQSLPAWLRQISGCFCQISATLSQISATLAQISATPPQI